MSKESQGKDKARRKKETFCVCQKKGIMRKKKKKEIEKERNDHAHVKIESVC